MAMVGSDAGVPQGKDQLPLSGRALFFLLIFLSEFWILGATPFNTSGASPGEPFPWSQTRLPSTVRPDHYFLYIHPDLQSETFTGQVRILLTVLKETNVIVMHGQGLAVETAILEDLFPAQVSERQLLLQVLQSPTTEQLALVSEKLLLEEHKYQLSITYNSSISHAFSGLYKASYQTPSGASRSIVATHFEPTAARKAFPCFDEPNMKAVFSLVIVRERDYMTLSNMPRGSTKPRDDGLEEDHYLTSVKMSSYLVAFVVCDFSFTSALTKRGLKVSVFAPSHQVNQTQFALQAAVRILNFYEDYFQIPYPLPKIDLAGIPDFEAGAMENWGLLTFRETALLYEEQTATNRSKVWISLVTAHELAHQWFGNLVTMKWWNDLWLNEGFASYMEYLAISHLEPSWNVEDHLLMDVYKALEEDSFSTSHPISVPVNNSAQIREIFDVVSYSKGVSIIRMLRNYLTEAVFIGGIRLYLHEHQYSNAQQEDLWGALHKATVMSGRVLDVKALMDTWTTQRGYPVVLVRKEGAVVHLQQRIFTKAPQNSTKDLWQIPLTFYTSNSSAVVTHLMTSDEEMLDLHGEVSWVKANVNSSGFYRVLYEEELMDALMVQLQVDPTVFSKVDRAGMIDDIFQLASQGSVEYNKAFQFSLFLKQEMEFLPIDVFLAHMTNMMVRFSFGGKLCLTRLLKEHVWSMLWSQARAQQWEDGGSQTNQELHARLLGMASGRRWPSAIQEAMRLFHFWMATDGGYQLPHALRALIFRMGVRKGGKAEWDFLLQKYRRTTDSRDKAVMLKALCQTSSRKKRTWLLEAALQNELVKTQDLAVIVEQLAYRPKANALTWEFVQSHWDELLSRFSLGSTYLSGIVTSVTGQFNSEEKYNEVYDFFVTQRHLGHLSFVKLSLEMIQVNQRWLSRHTQPIQAWLKKSHPGTFRTYYHCLKGMTYRFKWGSTIRFQL